MEAVRPTKPCTHKDITKVVKENKLQLTEGVDTREQLTSVGVLLLKFGCTNVLIVRAGRNIICRYDPCANNLVSINFL